MIGSLVEMWSQLEAIDRVNFVGVLVSSGLGIWALVDGANSRSVGVVRDQAAVYVTDFKAAIDTIVSAGLDYYSQEPDKTSTRHLVDVLGSFKKATTFANSLNNLSPDLDLRSELLSFKQLVTGDEWGDETRTQKNSGDPYLEKILEDGTQLSQHLQAAFDRRFFRRLSVVALFSRPTEFWLNYHR